MTRHSNLQKQVLSLYKQFLLAGKGKPGFLPQIQHEFRKNAKIPRTNIMIIEYLLRRGKRQLEQLQDVHTIQLGTFIKVSSDKEKPPTSTTLVQWLETPARHEKRHNQILNVKLMRWERPMQ